MPSAASSITLATYIDDELRSARLVWDQFADALLDQVMMKQRTAKLPAARIDADELARLLQANRAFMSVAYLDVLKAQARRVPRSAAAHSSGPGALRDRVKGQVLELVDLDSIALDVELSRVIQAIKDGAEHELRDVQAFLATLVGDADIEEDHNPFHPAAYGRALRAAAQVMRGPLDKQLAFVRAAAPLFAQHVRQAYADACARLERAGVEPASHRSIVTPDGRRVLQILPEVAYVPDLQRMRDSMPRARAPREPAAAAARGGVQVRHPLGRDSSAGAHEGGIDSARHPMHQPGGAAAARSSRQGEPTYDPVQQRSHERAAGLHQAQPAMPTTDHGRELARAADAEHALGSADRRAVELVNRLFKAFPLDERVPEDVRTVVARLRAPALRLTLRDATVLDQREHPLWKLIHLFAYQAEMLPRADDPERLRWLEFGRRTVEELAAASAQKTAAYQAALERIEQFLRERLAQRCAALATRFQALQSTEAGLAATQAGATTSPSSLNATLAAMLPDAKAGQTGGDEARLAAETWFNGLVPGEWLRVQLKGNWVHAQLLWQGERRQIVLLGDASADTTWALRRGVLLQMHMHGLAKTLKMRSLVGTAAMRVQEQIALDSVA
jgi:Protein of unknown function (DUF1631)